MDPTLTMRIYIAMMNITIAGNRTFEVIPANILNSFLKFLMIFYFNFLAFKKLNIYSITKTLNANVKCLDGAFLK